MIRILIVEDDFVSRAKLKAAVSGCGDCDAVPHGDLAVRMVEAAIREELPYCLITMDWNLPGMNGLDTVKAIRVRDKNVPVVMVTSEADKESVVKAIQAGVSDYVVKPFTQEQIVDKINRLCGAAAR